MEDERYLIDCYTEDSLKHGFPENSYTCVSPTQVAEIIANCSREMAGIVEVRISFLRKEADWEWANYWKREAQVRREYENLFRREVERYLPFIGCMSFAGPKAIVDWIFKQVEIKKK